MVRIYATTLAILSIFPTSLAANDANVLIGLFRDACLVSKNNVDHIAQVAQKMGLREANLAADQTYQYMVTPGERYFVHGNRGNEQIIISGLNASLDSLGPSVICSVKSFRVNIDDALRRLSKIGLYFEQMPGSVYVNRDQLNGQRALMFVQPIRVGNRTGVSVTIAQKK